MKRPVPFSHRLRYAFENTLSAGPIAIIGWLALLSLAIVLVAAAIIALFGIPADPEAGESWGFLEAAWNHAEELGVGFHALGQHGRFWVLSRLRFEAERYPEWGSAVALLDDHMIEKTQPLR